MWERPSPLAGYFTTCGNLNGDGTFAYRVAGFPLTAQRLALLAVDHFRAPANRLYAGGSLNGSTWESRHQLASVVYLIHLPFVLFALWLGGGLWWVARRLFGNEGGFFALGLYCFCPAVVRLAVTPNNDLLAMWGLYGLIYTAIGVAHAMQGPRRKWRPRIVLLTVALGLTAAAHLLAAILGFLAALIFMLYLAERRRGYVMQILIFSAIGALAILFAFYGFHLAAFSYVFTGGAARFWFSLAGMRSFVFDRGFAGSLANFPILIALRCRAALLRRPPQPLLRQHRAASGSARARAAHHHPDRQRALALGAAVLLHLPRRRLCRRAGNPHRKLFLVLTGAILAAQAMECLLTPAADRKPAFWLTSRMIPEHAMARQRLGYPRCLRWQGASALGPYAGCLATAAAFFTSARLRRARLRLHLRHQLVDGRVQVVDFRHMHPFVLRHYGDRRRGFHSQLLPQRPVRLHFLLELPRRIGHERQLQPMRLEEPPREVQHVVLAGNAGLRSKHSAAILVRRLRRHLVLQIARPHRRVEAPDMLLQREVPAHNRNIVVRRRLMHDGECGAQAGHSRSSNS